MAEATKTTLTPELTAFIDKWKSKPGNLTMVLQKAQETFSYIPREVAQEVSRRLNIPLAHIHGVVVFYHLFKLSKHGQDVPCRGDGNQSRLRLHGVDHAVRGAQTSAYAGSASTGV